jgi:FlaA1/EpsC-like NDP-sugar epimerase
MKKEIIYFSSGFGISIIIASLLNILIKKDIKKDIDKIILFWLWFGILAQLVHLLMHYNRIYRNKIGNSNLLFICTISQIIVIFLYIRTRKHFKNFKIILDFAMIQIVTIMIARAIALFNNSNLYYES